MAVNLLYVALIALSFPSAVEEAHKLPMPAFLTALGAFLVYTVWALVDLTRSFRLPGKLGGAGWLVG